jgi:hypothetical protein
MAMLTGFLVACSSSKVPNLCALENGGVNVYTADAAIKLRSMGDRTGMMSAGRPLLMNDEIWVTASRWPSFNGDFQNYYGSTSIFDRNASGNAAPKRPFPNYMGSVRVDAVHGLFLFYGWPAVSFLPLSWDGHSVLDTEEYVKFDWGPTALAVDTKRSAMILSTYSFGMNPDGAIRTYPITVRGTNPAPTREMRLGSDIPTRLLFDEVHDELIALVLKQGGGIELRGYAPDASGAAPAPLWSQPLVGVSELLLEPAPHDGFLLRGDSLRHLEVVYRNGGGQRFGDMPNLIQGVAVDAAHDELVITSTIGESRNATRGLVQVYRWSTYSSWPVPLRVISGGETGTPAATALASLDGDVVVLSPAARTIALLGGPAPQLIPLGDAGSAPAMVASGLRREIFVQVGPEVRVLNPDGAALRKLNKSGVDLALDEARGELWIEQVQGDRYGWDRYPIAATGDAPALANVVLPGHPFAFPAPDQVWTAEWSRIVLSRIDAAGAVAEVSSFKTAHNVIGKPALLGGKLFVPSYEGLDVYDTSGKLLSTHPGIRADSIVECR